MISNFTDTQDSGGYRSNSIADETYDLKGLNLVAPDPVMPKGESPFLTNTRMYARNAEENRVAQRTRPGSRRFSTPIGEAANVENVASQTGDVSLAVETNKLVPFTPSSTGALTKLEVEVKRSVAGSGHVIVEIFEDSDGLPGNKIAQSSIHPSLITDAYQYLPAYFIDAPTLTSGEQYWKGVRVQKGGTATYVVRKTAASGGVSTADSGETFSTLGYTWRYKTYLSTPGDIKGYTQRYPSDNANRTVFAFEGQIYATTHLGVSSSIGTYDANSDAVRFETVDDKTIWVDGLSAAQWWDGTTTSNVPNVPGTPDNVFVHQNRLFFVYSSENKIIWSGLYDFDSYRNVDFSYIPSPKSSDHITGCQIFRDDLHVFTHETKHLLIGTNLSNFQRRGAAGTKGAVSQEATATDHNYIYFMADDKHIYRYNGSDDEMLSEKIEPLLQGISDVSKVRFHIYRNQLRVYYPSTGDTQSEDMVMLELSRRDSNKYLQWFHDTGRPVTGSLELTQDNNELIEFSSRVGALYTGDVGTSDLGKAISFKYWTPYKVYSSGSAEDRIKRFRPYIRPSDAAYTMQVGKDVDYANNPTMKDYLVDPGGAKWGEFIWGDGTVYGGGSELVDDKVALSGRGKRTQYRFECDLVDRPVELLGYMGLIKSGRIR